MNLYDFLLEHSDDTKPVIFTRDGQVSYGELKAMAEGIASALRQFGIENGDRVAIIAENSPFWVASYLGIIKIGAVAVPIPLRLATETLSKIIEMMGIRTFCMDARRFTNYKVGLPAYSQILIPDTDTHAALDNFRYVVPTTCPLSPTVVVDEQRDLAALMFTSGSSGQPNAVKVTHRNIMANTASIVEYLELTANDVMMVVLPFDYCYGTSLLHTHLRAGATLVLNNNFMFVETVLRDIENFHCTGFAGVPTVYQHILRGSRLHRYNLQSLRYAQLAGGKLPEIFIQQFIDAVPHCRLFVMYGQTEATARLSYLPPERLHDKLGSIGRGIPGVKLQVVDETGQPVKPGVIGEIVAEGDNITAGYWLPDSAKNPFRDGKLYTGDMARIDDDGFIYITGRNSEFMKLNGHRVSSAEIEGVLYELPDILEVAVIGLMDSEMGEVAQANIVLRDGVELTPTQVIQHCKKRLPPYAVPRVVEFVNELPKNAAGKILKRELQGKS